MSTNEQDEQDHRQWSEAQDAITYIKDFNNRVIASAITELQFELIERGVKGVKNLTKKGDK